MIELFEWTWLYSKVVLEEKRDLLAATSKRERVKKHQVIATRAVCESAKTAWGRTEELF